MDNATFSYNVITYLENRISLLDNKASILLAIQTLFIGVIYYIAKDYSLPQLQHNLYLYFYSFLYLSTIIFIRSIYLLLQTIRPTKRLSAKVDTENISESLMWFKKNDQIDFEEFKGRIKQNDKDSFLNSLIVTQYKCIQLNKLKYNYYRKAMRLIRIYLLLNFIGFSIIWLVNTILINF